MRDVELGGNDGDPLVAVKGRLSAGRRQIRSARIQTIVLALFTLDMLFLPMFHIGRIPFKPFYLVIVAYIVTAVRLRSARPLVVLCWSFAAVCWIGGFFLFVLDQQAGFAETARNSLVWFLSPLAFAFGWQHRRARLGFMLFFIPLYFLLNLVLRFAYAELPWLISFYGLEDRIAWGVFHMRSPGIHYNPNLSALAANLMLLAAVIAERQGIIRSRVLVRWVVFLSIMGTHLLLASRSEFAAALLLGAFWVYVTTAQRRHMLRFVLIGGTTAVIFLTAFYVLLEQLSSRTEMFSFARNQFTSGVTLRLADEHTPEARLNSILFRPFVLAEEGYDRFRMSPLWGTGFDVAERYPFDSTYFHNDWIVVVVAGGIIGLVLFIGVLLRLKVLGWIILTPFFLTAPVNSFILAPQHMMFYFAMAGYIAGAVRRRALRSAHHGHDR